MTIELIVDRECPNVVAARAQLRQALLRARLPVRWKEWDRAASDSPARVRNFGSPTILVDGRDILGQGLGDGNCCRLYRSGERLVGVPEVGDLTQAFLQAREGGRAEKGSVTGRARWRETLGVLLAAAAALLPKLACPACWPTYAGLLSALGLPFLNYTPFLPVLTGLFLLIALGPLLFAARRHRRTGPVILGVVAAALVLAGKFLWNSEIVMLGGLALLAGASFRNAWLCRQDCCAADGDGGQIAPAAGAAPPARNS
ncbi:MAG: MerC domain-containing protein [Methylacidiphilaceae bacterium]|nr:MerC domain-containing protein [Candidatus Methylacidiphilaceae bacterium]